ncbi:class I SAM-dependent RNA methyltransferase [Candidatus Latescibacterota bacterium]
MYTYQKSGRFFAQHADGMETVAVDELREMKVKNIKPSFRGVFFETDMAGLYEVNYCSRLMSRILAPLLIFDCHSTKYLYKTARKILWDDFMTVDTTFAITATVSHSQIKHSQYASLCLKDAIVDHFRDRHGKRPNVDTDNPDVWFNLHIQNNRATISLDTSQGSLHRRGYRTESVEAPMQETLAAAIIRMTGWDGSRPLYDPMCGSGTLLCEALMSYCNVPSGTFRKRFGFEQLPDFNASHWAKVKKNIDRKIRPLPEGLMAGSDNDPNAVKAAKKNSRKIPGGNNLMVTREDFNSIPGLENRIIVCNPPYGIRTGKKDDMKDLYHSIGEFLKHKCKGAEAYIYLGDRSLLKHMALRKSWKKELKNGGLEGILVKFEMY